MFSHGVRFLDFKYRTPYENMALDEHLLNLSIADKTSFLRLYGWEPAGLSIGVNQEMATVDTARCASDRVPVVRRLTGGGAIFHDKELTYCIVLPQEELPKGLSVKESFEKLNSFIIGFYSKLGLSAAYAREVLPENTHGRRAAFCFGSSEEYDIIVAGKKIGGNAQARKKGVIFQHGSIPLAESQGERYVKDAASGTPHTCLNELTGRDMDVIEAAANLTASFMETFRADLKPYELTMEDKRHVVHLMTTKYARAEWTDGK